jgi:hypothetical protein
MDEFSQSVPVPINKRSIQRRLSNLWLSQENCCEKNDNFVENRKNRVRWYRNRLHWTLHGLFSIFSHGSNLLKKLDTADRLNPMIFPISVFLNPS